MGGIPLYEAEHEHKNARRFRHHERPRYPSPGFILAANHAERGSHSPILSLSTRLGTPPPRLSIGLDA